MRVERCGDAAFVITLATTPGAAVSRQIAGLHRALAAQRPVGYLESIPGMVTLTVLFDPDRTDVERLADAMRGLLGSTATQQAARLWTIPVCYDERYGLDVRSVSERTGLSPAEIVSLHTGATYTVYFLGFSPGFPYMGVLDARLALPRREEPRPAVPTGSVAIATRHTAIYPHATPGGWHVLGRTPVRLFDARAAQPALLAAGDSVRCTAITAEEYETLVRNVAQGRYVPHCEVAP